MSLTSAWAAPAADGLRQHHGTADRGGGKQVWQSHSGDSIHRVGRETAGGPLRRVETQSPAGIDRGVPLRPNLCHPSVRHTNAAARRRGRRRTRSGRARRPGPGRVDVATPRVPIAPVTAAADPSGRRLGLRGTDRHAAGPNRFVSAWPRTEEKSIKGRRFSSSSGGQLCSRRSWWPPLRHQPWPTFRQLQLGFREHGLRHSAFIRARAPIPAGPTRPAC
jgi:hypothetical protein